MKILHFLLFLSVAGFPQTAWEVINPLPQEKTINAVQIIKDSLVYAAGENGAFLHSNDYGITWQRKPQGVEKTFLSIYFADEMTGWLGAGGGEMYRTTDGGYNFNVVQTFPGRDIIKIKLNGNSGYACSREGELYRTNDGFSTYTVRVITNTEVISDILIRENGKGVAAGEDGGIYTTANEGETWVKSAYTAQGPLYGVTKIDNNRTAVYGFNGYLAVSSDEGVNWIAQNVGNSNLSSVEVTAGGEIVAANVTGEIYISRDAGITWEVSLSGDDVSYRGMAVSGNFIFAAGEYGVMSASTNNGTDWSYRSTGSRVRLNRIRFIDPDYGFIIGDKGLLLVTSDGGNTWEKKNTGTTKELFDFHLFKNGQGAFGIWLVGANGTHLQSSDTGKTFKNGAMAAVVGQNLRTVFMGDNLSRIAGDAGTSYESLGRWGSAGWRKAGNYGSNINFYDFWPTTPSIGFLVGSQGTIIRYFYYFRAVAQENISWEVPYELRSVFFIDQKFGWIVGE
ncbi:MAG: hypothetical protein HUU54_17630, partial [Ignavibacteriaceae bacterium]|nr:hypothetical protein [Ignavibacteriaceae bacterium]